MLKSRDPPSSEDSSHALFPGSNQMQTFMFRVSMSLLTIALYRGCRIRILHAALVFLTSSKTLPGHAFPGATPLAISCLSCAASCLFCFFLATALSRLCRLLSVFIWSSWRVSGRSSSSSSSSSESELTLSVVDGGSIVMVVPLCSTGAPSSCRPVGFCFEVNTCKTLVERCSSRDRTVIMLRVVMPSSPTISRLSGTSQPSFV
mmetsp:Transcript_40729/g.77775  ORF Transcript_40729/g.77775 Transcript_40729/m.77775 type:complete len:204 (-) Transcript_40729:1631-2242(-)